MRIKIKKSKIVRNVKQNSHSVKRDKYAGNVMEHFVQLVLPRQFHFLNLDSRIEIKRMFVIIALTIF